jgi:AcrR family transcriptional regulator
MARGRRSQAEKRDENRRKILRAARGVFGRRGYHGATIEEIGRQADLSTGAIYYNFASKEGLFLALLEERIEERIDQLRAGVDAGAGAPAGPSALLAQAEDMTASLRENVEWRLLFLEFVVHSARNPRFRKQFNALRARMREALVEQIERRFADAGVKPPLPPEQLALAISGIVNGLGMEEVVDPGTVGDRLLGSVLGLLLGDA